MSACEGQAGRAAGGGGGPSLPPERTSAPEPRRWLAGLRAHASAEANARRPSTTLADLRTRLLVANPFSAVRASRRRWSSDEFEDGLAHGGQGRLRRWPVDSFFPALLFCADDAGGKRRRSSSSAHDGVGLARIGPRSDRGRVLLSVAGEPARKSIAP